MLTRETITAVNSPPPLLRCFVSLPVADIFLTYEPLNLQLCDIISLKGLSNLQAAGRQTVMAPNVKIRVIRHSRWTPFKAEGKALNEQLYKSDKMRYFRIKVVFSVSSEADLSLFTLSKHVNDVQLSN